MTDTRERIVEDLAESLRRRGVSGWVSDEPMALARAIVKDLLSTRRCDYWEDNVRGDIGGPCRKLLGHDGDHDPFEHVTPDALRKTFGLDVTPDSAPERRQLADNLIDAVEDALQSEALPDDIHGCLQRAYDDVVEEVNR